MTKCLARSKLGKKGLILSHGLQACSSLRQSRHSGRRLHHVRGSVQCVLTSLQIRKQKEESRAVSLPPRDSLPTAKPQLPKFHTLPQTAHTSSWGPSFQTQEPVGGIWHANCNTNPGGCHFLLYYSSLAIVFHQILPNGWSEINPSTTRARDSMERALSWSLLAPLSGHKLLHGEEQGELSSSMLWILRLKLDYIWDMYDQERKKWKKVVQEELPKHNPIICIGHIAHTYTLRIKETSTYWNRNYRKSINNEKTEDEGW